MPLSGVIFLPTAVIFETMVYIHISLIITMKIKYLGINKIDQ